MELNRCALLSPADICHSGVSKSSLNTLLKLQKDTPDYRREGCESGVRVPVGGADSPAVVSELKSASVRAYRPGKPLLRPVPSIFPM